MIPKEFRYETDIKIINALKKNGRISMTDLGRQIYFSSQAVKNRLERLQDLGIVERYTVNVNLPGLWLRCTWYFRAHIVRRQEI